jgi:diamine N-acetyltransferase
MIYLRHARLNEKPKIYNWLCKSDTTPLMMGLPDYPEHPVPDWNQFQHDFQDNYFLESGQKKGSVLVISNDCEEIGSICYSLMHLQPHTAELDIWLNNTKYCGHGFGCEALKMLIANLHKNIGITRFLIRPSKKNSRAIKAYKKAGFQIVDNEKTTIQEYLLPGALEEYGAGDYGQGNTAVLTLDLS